MDGCPYCGAPLPPGPPWAPGKGHRLAFDPEKGRLWNVCPSCARWTLTPLESRWETLEACEEAVRMHGDIRLSTPHLALMDVGAGELVRVGLPPRSEFVDWRYGARLAPPEDERGFWARLIATFPAPPVGGYDPYRGFEGALRSQPWFASPFLESAASLTYLFSHVALAPTCPSCRKPLALEPWSFQAIRLVPLHSGPAVQAYCAFCLTEVTVDLAAARPVLRIGLGFVTPGDQLRAVAARSARELDAAGGPLGFLRDVSRAHLTLGDLDELGRSGLIISLDEMAEMEALEAEWRRAEEMAAIMDGELSRVPGFDEFKRKILGLDR